MLDTKKIRSFVLTALASAAAVVMSAAVVHAADFSVTVPTSLPVSVGANGAVTVSNTAKCTNNGTAYYASISSVAISGYNGWTYDGSNVSGTNYGSTKVNSHRFTMSASIPNTSMAPGEQVAITYNAKVPTQSVAMSNQRIASVVVTVAQGSPVMDTFITFESTADFTIGVNNATKNWDGTLEYSTNKSTWTTWDGTNVISSANTTLYLRGVGNTLLSVGSNQNTGRFVLTASANVTCSGNIETLLDYPTVVAGNHPIMGDYAFTYLFADMNELISLLELPATTLSKSCYYYMFRNTATTTAPELPATIMKDSCYYGMFSMCTGLTSAPELPAETLAQGCYSNMLSNTGLTSAPALPAEVMKNNCYSNMFAGCKDLTVAPVLKSTTLDTSCYLSMFRGCTGLTYAPSLPATTLANYCYSSMFYGCTGLTSAPTLAATTMKQSCYSSMFYGCTNLTSVPTTYLPATTLATSCYEEMFRGSGLTSAPNLPATTLAKTCYKNMFTGTKITTTPAMSATTLDQSCCEYMFYDCKALTAVQVPPATTMVKYCYRCMFQGCTSLTSPPSLPGTTMADYCYYSMFYGCTSLTSPPQLTATNTAVYCYGHMFHGCTNLTTLPNLPATTLEGFCYSYMFSGCTKIQVSETRTGAYTRAYRIPQSGTGTNVSSPGGDHMFYQTGGTFTGSPTINTTYYTTNTLRSMTLDHNNNQVDGYTVDSE